MLTGHSMVPANFRGNLPQSTDLPSIAAVADYSTKRRSNMSPSVILPEKLYHSNSGVYSGQMRGLLGAHNDPWLIECTDKPHAYHDYSGAFPKFLFNLHDGVPSDQDDWRFEVPHLSLQEGILESDFITAWRCSRRSTSSAANSSRQPKSLITTASVRESSP